MDTYRTLDARVLDLTTLAPAEREYLEGRYLAYRDNPPYQEFWPTTSGSGNPLVRAAGGRVTNAVWNHPLYQAVRDLEERLGIRQGEIAANPGDDVAADPFADDWITVAEAARRKEVAPTAIHKAIGRGDLIARPLRAGGKWLLVSVNSILGWQPSPRRQAAARESRGRGARRVPAPAA